MLYCIWRQRNIFQVLYEAPYAILYHFGLELPENTPNDTFSAWFCVSIPMHTISDQLNHTGIEVTKRQTAYARCLCVSGYNLENLGEIQSNRKSLHNLSEAIRIDSLFTRDMKSWHYNTTAILFSLFYVMFHL